MLCRLLLGLFLLLAVDGQATTYYVATAGDGGSNSNNGTSIDTPKLTIAHTVGLMQQGDTAYVRGGTHSGASIRFGRSGTQAAPIKLLNYPGESPVISCVDPNTQWIAIANFAGENKPMGWITIEGFEITNCYYGVKYYNLHDSVIRRNWIHDNPPGAGIQGNGTRILIDHNIINHNGYSRLNHGIYANGTAYTVTNNLIYDNAQYGIQLNGSSGVIYNPALHAGPEFAESHNWIIANNTFAYQLQRAGIVVWGSRCNNTRIENNIFYENGTTLSSGGGQGIDFSSCCSTGIQIRNNHSYASGSGATVFLSASSAVEGVHYTQSGNVVNVSSPAFVTGGSNALPGSPDFSLTSSSPAIGMAYVNEFPRNASRTVGAFDTVGTPIASITANKITITFPMSNAVPIKSLSISGVTVNCTVNVCPGADVVSTVTNPSGTDSQVEITLTGIIGNACFFHADAVTTSYAPGTWTGNDHIGPHPGLHQKIFAFTHLTVVNSCTGGGTSSVPGTPHIYYRFDASDGNDETANNLDCTPTNSPTWGAGKSGIAMVTANGTTQHCALPWGSGINPTTQDMTWAVGVFVPSGSENAQRFVLGPDLGTNQRGYIAAQDGTWRMSTQSTPVTSVPASNLAVTAGWNFLTALWNSGTDTVYLYKDSVLGNGGAVRTYTSYTFASNLKLVLIGTNVAKDGRYDEVTIYLALEDPAALFAAFQGSAPPPATGTLAQAAIQFQDVYLLSVGGSPTNLGALNAAKDVVLNGAVAVMFQVHCQNVANCDPTAFRATYRKNGSLTNIHVPNTETADGLWMWGPSSDPLLNAGVTTARLTGSCPVTNGSTQLTAEQIPNVDLPQDGCVMLRYIVRLGSNLVPGDYFDLKLLTESGLGLSGGYAAEARINVIAPQASAGP